MKGSIAFIRLPEWFIMHHKNLPELFTYEEKEKGRGKILYEEKKKFLRWE